MLTLFLYKAFGGDEGFAPIFHFANLARNTSLRLT